MFVVERNKRLKGREKKKEKTGSRGEEIVVLIYC